MSNRDSVSILLPGNADVIAMTEQALVAMDEFGNWLADVISAPRRRIFGVVGTFRGRRGLLREGEDSPGGKRQRREGDSADEAKFISAKIHLPTRLVASRSMPDEVGTGSDSDRVLEGAIKW